LKNIISTQAMIKKCLFPAAGYGTRFLPATKAVPKEMLPVLNKPLLQYAIEEALSAGISNMAIVTGRGKRAIEDHFDNSIELESQLKGTSSEHYLKEIKNVIENANFTYVRQSEMLGLGHAILTGETLIGKETFGVILADDLCIAEDSVVLEQLSNVYSKYKCSVIAIEEVPISKVHNYGIVTGSLINDSEDIYQITDLVEKPNEVDAPSNLAVIGRYILTPEIFDILKNIKPGKDGELQITDALKLQAQMGNVLGFKFKAKRFDCGSINGYLDANNYLAKLKGITD
jgi:UTP--glucose-1-phosphate uridylyltransferase